MILEQPNISFWKNMTKGELNSQFNQSIFVLLTISAFFSFSNHTNFSSSSLGTAEKASSPSLRVDAIKYLRTVLAYYS